MPFHFEPAVHDEIIRAGGILLADHESGTISFAALYDELCVHHALVALLNTKDAMEEMGVEPFSGEFESVPIAPAIASEEEFDEWMNGVAAGLQDVAGFYSVPVDCLTKDE